MYRVGSRVHRRCYIENRFSEEFGSIAERREVVLRRGCEVRRGIFLNICVYIYKME